MKAYLKTNHPDIVRILRLTLYEVHAWFVHLAGAPRRRLVARRLRNATGLRLNIASGGVVKPGWIGMDVSPTADIRMDLRRRFPLNDNSVELLFCEHFADHLNYPDTIKRFLSECRRVLAQGGRARFVLHDVEDLARAYLQRDERYFRVGEMLLPTANMAMNFLFRFNDFHQFLYDFETFQKLLLEAGFSRVEKCKFKQSERPEIVLDMDLPSREILSMYVEAVK